MKVAAIVLAACSSAAITAGVALVFVPAGLVVGGLLGVGGAYVMAYLGADR